MARLFGIALAILALDQITKHLASLFLRPEQSLPLIPGLVHLTLVRNFGSAFGLLANQTHFFIAISVAVVLAIVFFYNRLASQGRYLGLALSLQLGGALGNLVDRLRFGYVVDFVDLRVWPVFNLADAAIVAGVGLLCLELLWPAAGKREAA